MWIPYWKIIELGLNWEQIQHVYLSSITYPDDSSQISSTTDPGLTYIAGKPGLVLRKVKGRMKTTSTSPPTEMSSKKVNLKYQVPESITNRVDVLLGQRCKWDFRNKSKDILHPLTLKKHFKLQP